MKYGVREVANAVLRAKAAMTFGGVSYGINEPVLYFDYLKVTNLSGESSTTYQTGGRGNPRILGWDSEKEVTFKMEDALISPESFAMLAGGTLSKAITIYMHKKEIVLASAGGAGTLGDAASAAAGYEPNVYAYDTATGDIGAKEAGASVAGAALTGATADSYVLVDFYVEKTGDQIIVESDKFAGTFKLEADTLFRQLDGTDVSAQFVVPKAKIKTNFEMNMEPSGDPSSFNFEMDVFSEKNVDGKNVMFYLDILAEDINA